MARQDKLEAAEEKLRHAQAQVERIQQDKDRAARLEKAQAVEAKLAAAAKAASETYKTARAEFLMASGIISAVRQVDLGGGENMPEFVWNPDFIKHVEQGIGVSFDDRESLRPGNQKRGPDPFTMTLMALRDRAVAQDPLLKKLRTTRDEALAAERKAHNEVYSLQTALRNAANAVKLAEYEVSEVKRLRAEAKQKREEAKVKAAPTQPTPGPDPELLRTARKTLAAITEGTQKVGWRGIL